jgi:Family of unknown function (DUF5681)
MMNPTGKMPSCDEHAAGHGEPLGSRQRGMTAARVQELLMEEAYRPVCVRQGDEIVTLPAIQAVLRSQIALAINGNCAAQRFVIEAVQAVEQDLAIEAAAKEAERPEMSNTELARRISFILERAAREKALRERGEPPPKLITDFPDRDCSPSAS